MKYTTFYMPTTMSLVDGIMQQREQPTSSCRKGTIGAHFTRMLKNMYQDVMIVKRWRNPHKKMRCHVTSPNFTKN